MIIAAAVVIAVVVAIFAIPKLLGGGAGSSATFGTKHSKAWLTKPRQVWELEDVRAGLPTVGSQYFTVQTGETVMVIDIETGAPQFTLADLNTEDIDFEQLTQFGDEILLNTNAGPSAGAYVLATGERTASAEFIAATTRDGFIWSEGATYSTPGSASSEFAVEVYDPQTTTLVHSCTLEQVSADGSAAAIVEFGVHFDGTSALLQRNNSQVEIVDLATCHLTPVVLTSDSDLKLETMIPTTDGWWAAAKRSDNDAYQTLHISPAGKVTDEVLYVGHPSIFAPGIPSQRFSAGELDTAFGTRQPLDNDLVFQKTGGKLHVTAWALGDSRTIQHYLDGTLVPWFDDAWGMFITDFDHALISREGELHFIAADRDTPIWSIPGDSVLATGKSLVVFSIDAGTLRGYAPGNG
ncbi:MAG: hypothetical protein Q4Q03_02490 [Bowdeniella nasicola]|nr:hypothetical protein [Bowdeniella nasicola]